MNPQHVVMTETFFNNIPDNSYIEILKPPDGMPVFVTVRTLDKVRLRGFSQGNNLQDCINELSMADMTLKPIKKVGIDADKIDSKIKDVLRKIWEGIRDE